MTYELCGICADHNKVVHNVRGKVLLCSQRPKDCPGFKPMKNNAEEADE